jgi:hypothetical protein
VPLANQAGEGDGEQGGQDGEGDKQGAGDGQGDGGNQGDGEKQGDGRKGEAAGDRPAATGADDAGDRRSQAGGGQGTGDGARAQALLRIALESSDGSLADLANSQLDRLDTAGNS